MDANVGPEPEVSSAVKEALRSQQQLLQSLYAELDEEREASATAASEALSMILRLQGEKAAVKMEADQYRRMAEERMCHAERSVEVFKDVVRQKDMEIASLEFQVLAYRYKLMSMGCCGDLGVSENRFLEDLFRQRFDLYGWGGKESGGANVRRMSSLPTPCLKGLHRRKDDGVAENQFGNLANRDPKPFCGGQVEALSDNDDSLCHPIMSHLSSEHRTEPDRAEYSDAVTTKEVPGDAVFAVSVHDVFEVPGIERDGCVMLVRDEGDDNRLGKPESHTDACAGWIKEMLVSLNNDKVHSKSREITACVNGDDNDVTIQEIGDAEIRNDVRALSERVERLEKESSGQSEGIVRHQSTILKEIREELSSIKGEMRRERSKINARPQRCQPSLLALQEAMLHFWL